MLHPGHPVSSHSHLHGSECNTTHPGPSHGNFPHMNGIPKEFPPKHSFCPLISWGLGFHHIGFEHDIQKVLFVIKHLRTQSTHGKVLKIFIDFTQLYTSLSKPILKKLAIM